jgi:hypothetical protein
MNIFKVSDSIISVKDYTKNELIEISTSPNPFKSETKINFTIPISGLVRVIITDILGNEIAVLKDEYCQEGQYRLIFNANEYNISKGIYFCTVSAGGVRVSIAIYISE